MWEIFEEKQGGGGGGHQEHHVKHAGFEMTIRIQIKVPSNPRAMWIRSSRKGSEPEL